jgi:hypothetical protein
LVSFLPANSSRLTSRMSAILTAKQRRGVTVFPAGVNAGAGAEQFGQTGLGDLTSHAELPEALMKVRDIPVGRKTLTLSHLKTSSQVSC